MADLGSGTMPRGKYPESPAPAGSHALISRTPTPGGMLHANLGLPRPPPRNFQPPLPQPPSKQTATAPPKKTKPLVLPLPRRHAWLAGPPANTCPRNNPQNKRQQRSPTKQKNKAPRAAAPAAACVAGRSRGCERIPLRHWSNLQEKNNIVIPEFSAWLTLVLEQCRAENIRNLPRQRAPTPLFPERRPREACSMPISGCHDLPLATFNLPSRNNLQNKPNSAPIKPMSFPSSEHVK